MAKLKTSKVGCVICRDVEIGKLEFEGSEHFLLFVRNLKLRYVRML